MMDRDVFFQYQHFKRTLAQAKHAPSAQRICNAVDAYDQLYRQLNRSAQQQLDQLVSRQLPLEWRLWRRCADSYRRWPEVFGNR